MSNDNWRDTQETEIAATGAAPSEDSAAADASVFVRAIGPSLTAFRVPGALQNPTLELHDVSGTTLATNDDWKETQQA